MTENTINAEWKRPLRAIFNQASRMVPAATTHA